MGHDGVLVHNMCQNTASRITQTRKYNDNQKALIQLAKENRHRVSKKDAEALVSWAREYGIRNHGIMIHPKRFGIRSYTPHIKIANIHIPVRW